MNMEAALRQRINNMRGRDITLVVHKQLSRTDVCPGHDTLKLYSAPTLERLARKFLTEDEKQRILERQIIDVPTIGPNLEDTELALTVQSKTTTRSQSGGKADQTICVLRRGWSEVVAKYGLQKGDVVQVWSFRVGDDDDDHGGRLHMAVVVVRRGPSGVSCLLAFLDWVCLLVCLIPLVKFISK